MKGFNYLLNNKTLKHVLNAYEAEAVLTTY